MDQPRPNPRQPERDPTIRSVSGLPGFDDGNLPHFIRAEANLLRLPLFALHTKGLKTLDGIECSGRITRDGETHQFTFRATRNTATLYPGPLARAAHLAFLSLITEQGFPLTNPVTWGWRDLCRRMGVSCGGLTVRHLKDAITSTAGLLLHSEYALYSKPDTAPICTREDALHLYERVAFIGSALSDGSTADTNHLWLSEWYLNNINAMFTAPLDFSLWQFLDQRSSIASRLYEFLLLNFYSGSPVLRINYDTLTRFLPIRPERYRSHAKQQLEPAFQLLKATQILDAADWSDSKDGRVQLHLYRGNLLTAPTDRQQEAFTPLGEEFTDAIAVRELRNLKPPEWELVAEFYRLWSNDSKVRPTPKELAQASDLIAQHGRAKAKAFIPLVVKLMKEKWPDAKSFGALVKYLPEAASEYDQQQRIAENRKQEKLRDEQERLAVADRAGKRAALRVLWEKLPVAEQANIRDAVLAKQPRSLKRYPRIIESFCLDELARRQ